jgi:hypothetical protein
MGWGETPGVVGNDAGFAFTTNNFSQYYAEFNQVYALMLFLHLASGPAASIVPRDATSILSALKTRLDSPLRWPEDVTYEEMNCEGPGLVERILLRVAHDVGDAAPS